MIQLLKKISKIQKEQGFSGRSEVIRTAIRKLITDTKEKEKFIGHINSILLLIHKH